ncbi:MAG: hypothetical protein JXK05_13915 [Campylobacterales bacterium]|nr:hypothetical protein [Campylobacterales bacterium]
MKVAIQCVSPLLQRSLELFLKDRLSSLKQCDVVIRDRLSSDVSHPQFVIAQGADAQLSKPFSKSQLLLALEQFIGRNEVHVALSSMDEAFEPAATDRLGALEARIVRLTQNYQNELIQLIREHYGQH